jgi:hypothetical protein
VVKVRRSLLKSEEKAMRLWLAVAMAPTIRHMQSCASNPDEKLQASKPGRIAENSLDGRMFGTRSVKISGNWFDDLE